MRVTIIGKPKVYASKEEYPSKLQREKAQDFMNLLAIANVLGQNRETDHKYLWLNFDEFKFHYGDAGGYMQLDGSSESLMHLIKHDWLLEQILPKQNLGKEVV